MCCLRGVLDMEEGEGGEMFRDRRRLDSDGRKRNADKANWSSPGLQIQFQAGDRERSTSVLLFKAAVPPPGFVQLPSTHSRATSPWHVSTGGTPWLIPSLAPELQFL